MNASEEHKKMARLCKARITAVALLAQEENEAQAKLAEIEEQARLEEEAEIAELNANKQEAQGTNTIKQ